MSAVAKNYKLILVVLFVGVAIYITYKYMAMLKEKYALQETVSGVKAQLVLLENEKQNLLREIEKEKKAQQKLMQQKFTLQEYLKASRNRLNKLFADYAQVQETAADLSSQMSLLKIENTSLAESKEKSSRENENLKAKLSSVSELKKAIRELKSERYKVGRETKKRVWREEACDGNRGFLIKEGRPVHPAKVKIEVSPAPEVK